MEYVVVVVVVIVVVVQLVGEHFCSCLVDLAGPPFLYLDNTAGFLLFFVDWLVGHWAAKLCSH